MIRPIQMIRPIPVVCVTGAAKTRRCTMTAGRGKRTRVSVRGVLFPQSTVFSGCRILAVRGHLFIIRNQGQVAQDTGR